MKMRNVFPKSKEFKAEMSIVREKIANVKRRCMSSGFADYQGCRFICYSFIDILEDAGKSSERGEYAYAYSVAALILINLAKLASTSDDSAGGITDARWYVQEVLEKVCSNVEYGSIEAEYIFTQSVKNSQNKSFDGWDEFAYDILLKTARLATKDNEQMMYEAVDDLYKKLSEHPYSSWVDEYSALVRLEIIKATGCEADAAEFIKANLKFDAIRRIAVNSAVSTQNYSFAENLCLEKLNSDVEINNYSRPSEWRYLLFEIYDKSGETEKKIQTAKKLLFCFDTKYYKVLKQLLYEKGIWESEYPSLLESLRQSLPYHIYMQILSWEDETSRLLEEVKKHPASIFDYGKQLTVQFAEQTYTHCHDVIRVQASEADNRSRYKNVCGLIKKLFEFGGVAESEAIIAELKMKFPHRPAMLDELDALLVKLNKKRK
jgi:hypothetical protein